jgi:lysophospholipase L1-like esterase
MTALRHQTRPAIALLTLAFVTLLSGCGPKEKGGVDAWHGAVYAAMGDSYTAAPRLAPQTTRLTPSGCGQSASNYPHLIARRLGAVDFSDRSCLSARVGDLGGVQVVAGGRNKPQGEDIGEQTQLITLGIGGNDIPLTQLLGWCISAATAKKPCDAVGAARQAGRPFEDSFGRLADVLPQVFDEIARRAPKSTVLLIGYPMIVPRRGSRRCVAKTRIAANGMLYIDRQTRRLNAVLKKAAYTAGAEYVDVYGPSIGHDACQAADIRWIEPADAKFHADSFHPNPLGQRRVADLVIAKLALTPPR